MTENIGSEFMQHKLCCISHNLHRSTVFVSHKKPTHIQVQSATVQPSQQASPQQQQTIIAQTQQQANLLQSPGQQLIWHNQRLYAIVPQGKIHFYQSYSMNDTII